MEKLTQKLKKLIQRFFWLLFFTLKHPLRTLKKLFKWFLATWPRRLLASFLIILFIIAPLSFLFNKNKASAAWWNDMWQYRKPIAVTNSSGGILTDFQVKILSNVNLSTDITNGKIQSDLDDLRFTDINGNLLPYWIEDTTTTSVDVWAKLPSIPTSGATVYMYYGNGSATSVQDGNQVFEFFDDFNGSSIDINKWNVTGTLLSISNGRLRAERANGTGNMYSKVTYPRAFVLDMDFYPTQYPSGWEGSYHGSIAFGTFNVATKGREHAWIPYGGGGNSFSGLCDDGGCYHGQYVNPLVTGNTLYKTSMRIEPLIAGPQGVMTYFMEKFDGLGSRAAATVYTAATTGDDPLYIGIQDYGGNTSDDLEWDNWRIRKYASTDPTAASPATEEKGTGPIAYWSFDDGQGIIAQDKSQNNYDGTLGSTAGTDAGAPTWATESQCLSGKCLSFDGTDDAVDLGDYDDLKALQFDTGNWTISAWVKPIATATKRVIFGLRTGSDHDFMIGIDTDEKPYIEWVDYPSQSSYVTTKGPTAINDNKWHHIEVKREGGIITLYVDSVSVATDATVGTHSITANNWFSRWSIGAKFNGCCTTFDDGTWQSFFKGFIDEPKVYNYARSAAQIKMDYNAGIAGTGGAEGASATFGGKSQKWLTDGLVGHWKMDESSWNGTSGEVKDASGNENNGTRAGDATTAAGKFGNGGTFDGTGDYLDFGNPVALQLSSANQIAWSAWIKTSLNSQQTLFQHTSFNPRISLSNNRIDYYDAGNGTSIYSNTAILSDGAWHHIAVTINNRVLTFYVDGKPQGSSATGSYTMANLQIAIAAGSAVAFSGYIDDVRIYNRALQPQEVRDLYNYAPGPVGHWKMDENTGQYAYDTSGNGNNGTLGSSSGSDAADPTWTQGKIGSALNFDGSDDYVDVGNGVSLNITGAITIEAWIKPDALGNKAIVSRWGSGSQFLFSLYNNKLSLESPDNVFYYSNNAPTVNVWNHVAIILDGTNVKHYINGLLDKTQAQLDPLQFAQTSNLWIGQLTNYNSWSFGGSIDDVKIYNYARTPDQIKEDMLGRSGSSVSDKSTVGYWKFDEGYSTSTYDSSGNSNTGTITGATWSNDGKFGKALSFDGVDDYVDCGSGTSLNNISTSVTLAAWIKPSVGGAANQSIFDKAYSETFEMNVLNSTDIDMNMNIGGTYYPHFLAAGSNSIAVNNWNYVVFTYDNSGVAKWYINGMLKSTRTNVSGNIGTNTRALRIGGNRLPFKGLIDEPKVYNYALTADEVALDYNQGKSIQLGSSGTTATGAPSNSADRAYCPPGDTTATCGPIAEWKFDEMTGTNVYNTAGTNNGTLSGDPAWVMGKYNGGLRFDGSDDAMTINTTNIGNTNWTVSTWIKTTSSGSILSNNSGGPVTNNLRVSSSGKIQYLNYDGNWQTHSGAITVNDGRWHLLTWVNFSNQTMNMYVDGVPETGNGFGSYVTNAGPVNSIGRSYESRFNGTIDHMKIYNYSLNQSQIAWDYNRGAPVGWWRMDEGEGITVYDHSGKANNGTMTNMDGATDWVSGKINKALDFDGSNDYVEMYSNPIKTNNWTLAMWFNIRNSDQYDMLYSGADNVDIQLFFHASTKYLSTSVENVERTTSFKISDHYNEWHHVVWTHSNSNQTIVYIDGKIVLDATDTTYTNNGETIRIGQVVSGSSYYIDGKLDDIRVYNYALNQNQVNQIYNGSAINFK